MKSFVPLKQLLPDAAIEPPSRAPTLQTGESFGTTKHGSFEEMMMAYEREILVEAMKNAGGNQTRAARALKTTPRILSYRLKKRGLLDAFKNAD